MHAVQVPPFAATLGFSRLACAGLLLMWLCLWLACGQLDAQSQWVVLASAVLASLACLRRSGMWPRQPGRVAVDGRGACQINLQRVALQPSSVALPWLVWLHGRTGDGRRLGLLVWRDAVPAETHRALRVYVQWCRAAATQQAEEESL